MFRMSGPSSTGLSKHISSENGERSLETTVYRNSTADSKISLYKSSEEYFEYSCDPCNTAGEHVEAKGFCSNCGDYLCGNCLRSHSRSKASRHHTLLDKDNMPTKSVPLCEPCKREGDDEEAAGFCRDCEEYLCSGCYKSHSRSKASRQHVLFEKDKMPISPMRNEQYTHYKDIDIRFHLDVNNCFITGMTLMTSNNLILADQANNSLKYVDFRNNFVKERLQLDPPPVALAAISENELAVVLLNIYKSKIQIVSVSDGLSVVRTFNIDSRSKCSDIKYINGKLYALFYRPLCFKIFHPTGEVYKTIVPERTVEKNCTCPRYIAVSPDESLIYITDFGKVISIDMNGRMVSLFQGEVKSPCSITVSPTGLVYVCDREQHAVHKMTSALNDITVVLGQSDGFVFPQAICFDYDKQHLYISSGSEENKYSNVVKVYQWS